MCYCCRGESSSPPPKKRAFKATRGHMMAPSISRLGLLLALLLCVCPSRQWSVPASTGGASRSRAVATPTTSTTSATSAVSEGEVPIAPVAMTRRGALGHMVGILTSAVVLVAAEAEAKVGNLHLHFLGVAFKGRPGAQQGSKYLQSAHGLTLLHSFPSSCNSCRMSRPS